jgi:hypothetical protein
MTTHDSLCPWPDLKRTGGCHNCDLIARVRADEREFDRLKNDPNLTDEDGKDALYRHLAANETDERERLYENRARVIAGNERDARRETLAYLRAKVERLREPVEIQQRRTLSPAEVSYLDGASRALRDVLAIIDGSSE